MVNFITTIGFEEGSGGVAKTRTIDFELERPMDRGDGTIDTQSVEIHAPLLGLVPIPALLVETVDIKFTMEVKAHTEDTSSTEAEAGFSVNYSSVFSPVSGEAHGSVTTNSGHTRTTDNSAKYDVSVIARQQPSTEGLSKIMDLFASATDPIKLTKAGG